VTPCSPGNLGSVLAGLLNCASAPERGQGALLDLVDDLPDKFLLDAQVARSQQLPQQGARLRADHDADARGVPGTVLVQPAWVLAQVDGTVKLPDVRLQDASPHGDAEPEHLPDDVPGMPRQSAAVRVTPGAALRVRVGKGH